MACSSGKQCGTSRTSTRLIHRIRYSNRPFRGRAGQRNNKIVTPACCCWQQRSPSVYEIPVPLPPDDAKQVLKSGRAGRDCVLVVRLHDHREETSRAIANVLLRDLTNKSSVIFYIIPTKIPRFLQSRHIRVRYVTLVTCHVVKSSREKNKPRLLLSSQPGFSPRVFSPLPFSSPWCTTRQIVHNVIDGMNTVTCAFARLHNVFSPALPACILFAFRARGVVKL